jgi:DNA-directed RNA polymerase subunit RPC12/RpoP
MIYDCHICKKKIESQKPLSICEECYLKWSNLKKGG